MSRSRPTNINPSTRWHEWNGEKGNLKYYDKEKGKNVPVEIPFTFLLLDELSKVGGFNEDQQKGIYSNEVHYTKDEPLSVKVDGQLLAEGLYGDIKEEVKVNGGHYLSSLYIAYKDDEGELQIGNLALKGAALKAWVQFQDEVGQMKYEQAVRISAYSEDTYQTDDEQITFRYPEFKLQDVKGKTHEKAKALDAELQEYLDSKSKNTESPSTPPPQEPKDEPTPAKQPAAANSNFDDIDDDLPF